MKKTITYCDLCGDELAEEPQNRYDFQLVLPDERTYSCKLEVGFYTPPEVCKSCILRHVTQALFPPAVVEEAASEAVELVAPPSDMATLLARFESEDK